MNAVELKKRLYASEAKRRAAAQSPPSLRLELSAGYRAARRNTSVLCVIGLAWAAAQFDLKSVNLAGAYLDLTGAFIPLLLVCAIAFTTVRASIEYAMQPLEVRRWGYARLDLEVTVWLVRGTGLLLAASILGRSLLTVAYVIGAVIALGLASVVTMYLLSMLLMVVIGSYRKRQGRNSAAAAAYESASWAELLTYLLLLSFILAAAVASIYYEPIRTMWPIPPSVPVVVFATTTIVAVFASFVLQRYWFDSVRAEPASETTVMVPGRHPITRWYGRPPVVWDWGFDWAGERDRMARRELGERHFPDVRFDEHGRILSMPPSDPKP